MPERIDVRKTYKLYLGGEFVRSESGRSYQPQPEVNVPRGSRKDLRDAVKVARGAFAGWAGNSSQRWLLCKPARRSMRVGQLSFWLVVGAAW